MFQSWVDTLRCSDHFSIYLELGLGDNKPRDPYKYNPFRSNEEEFQELVKSSWKNLDESLEDSTYV
jgi:hypothetical protein